MALNLNQCTGDNLYVKNDKFGKYQLNIMSNQNKEKCSRVLSVHQCYFTFHCRLTAICTVMGEKA